MTMVTAFKGLMRHHQKDQHWYYGSAWRDREFIRRKNGQKLYKSEERNVYTNILLGSKMNPKSPNIKTLYNPAVKNQRQWFLKAIRKNWYTVCNGASVRLSVDFSGKTRKMSFENQEEIKTPPDKQKLKDKEFITTRFARRIVQFENYNSNSKPYWNIKFPGKGK